MRPTSSSTISYQPGDPPADPAQMQRYLREELMRIKAMFDALAAGHLDKTYAPPAKPRDGDTRYADGTLWNPGSGAGFYYFNGAIWKLLG
jgi:hypothetical protein